MGCIVINSPGGAKACSPVALAPGLFPFLRFESPEGATDIFAEEEIMAGTFTNLLYHVVFSTKNREQIIFDSFRERLYEYAGGIVRSKGGRLLSIGGTQDHIHIAVKLKQTEAVSKTIGELKGNLSKWINDNKFLDGYFSWQAGYAAFSVSESQVGELIGYIEMQQEHHRVKSFKEELIAILEKHQISYDPVLIWK
jgi:putative transposase